MIGGISSLEDDGYRILSKEYKREIKYSSGNLMQLHLRSVINQAVETVLNYFRGFPTLRQLKKTLANQPLRRLRPSPPIIYRRKEELTHFDNPILAFPDYFDFQDHLNPIFALDLVFLPAQTKQSYTERNYDLKA